MSTDAVIVEQPGLSQSERVIDTYVAPSKTFNDIFRSHSWWLPWLITSICALLFAFALAKKVDMNDLGTKTTVQQMEKFGHSPSEAEIAKIRQTAGKRTLINFYAMPLWFLIGSALMALLYWIGGNFILGGSGNYKSMFTLAMYATLPNALKFLLAAVVIWFGNNDNLDLKNWIGTNIGYYMGEDTPHYLHHLLSSIDLFAIWSLFLVALGISILARVKKGGAMGMVFGVWIVLIAIFAIF